MDVRIFCPKIACLYTQAKQIINLSLVSVFLSDVIQKEDEITLYGSVAVSLPAEVVNSDADFCRVSEMIPSLGT